jgi:hypothetical protein
LKWLICCLFLVSAFFSPFLSIKPTSSGWLIATLILFYGSSAAQS